MLIEGVQAYFDIKRKDGKSWVLTQWEKIIIGFFYLLGGVMWGTSLGFVAGYILSTYMKTSFAAGFIFVFLIPVLIRLGKLLSGSEVISGGNGTKLSPSDAIVVR